MDHFDSAKTSIRYFHSLISAMTKNFIVIEHDALEQPLRLNNFWLRDHCRCSTCFSAETHQRKFNFLDIPLDVRPVDLTIKGDCIHIACKCISNCVSVTYS